MATVIPRHVICALGKWRDLDEVDAVVQKVGGFELDRQFSQLSPDSRMMASFDASYDRVDSSMTENDWRAIREHASVAYVLSPPILKEAAAEISGTALLLTAALLREGGVAAKGEGAGIAHGRTRWLELARDFAGLTIVPTRGVKARLYTGHGSGGRSFHEMKGSTIPAECTCWAIATSRSTVHSTWRPPSSGSICSASIWRLTDRRDC